MAQIGSPSDQTVVISEAIAAARSGQKDLARQLLRGIIDYDPNHEQGFLWLAALAETPTAAIGHLERVLQINPNNLQALNALAVHRIHASNRMTRAVESAEERPRAAALPSPRTAAFAPSPGTNAGTRSVAVTNSPPATQTTPLRIPEPNAAGTRMGRHLWHCPLCEMDNVDGMTKCRRCGALQEIDDVWALAENRGVDEGLVAKGADKWIQRLIGGPDFEAHVNVAKAYLNLNRSAEAIVHLQRACEMRVMDRQLRAVLQTLRARKLVLAVDDSTTVRRLISVSLERKGYRVVTAEDGLQALARLAEHVPDLVLLDITMPKMDGYEVCKVIKGNQALKKVPVVMLSGKDGIFDKIKGRIAGATDYVAKPFDIAMLLHALEKHLGEEVHSRP